MRRWVPLLGAVLVFALLAGPPVGAGLVTPGETELVSLAADGTAASGDSHQAWVSADGRFVVFVSDTPDLVADGPDGRHVYLRDMHTGETLPVSEALGAGQNPFRPRIATAGDVVVFSTQATAEASVPGGSWVWRRDLGLERIGPHVPPNESPALSDNGRWVAHLDGGVRLLDLDSGASVEVCDCRPLQDLTVSDTGRVAMGLFDRGRPGGYYVEVVDTPSGERLDVSAGIDRMSFNPAISADGRHVAFLALRPEPLHAVDLWLRNLDTWALTHVSSVAEGYSMRIGISGDGGRVVFEAAPWFEGLRFLVGGTPPEPHEPVRAGIYAWDRSTGKYRLVSGDSDGLPGNRAFVHDDPPRCFRRIVGDVCVPAAQDAVSLAFGAFGPAISSDGRYVVFHTAEALDPRDTNQHTDVYIRDLEAGCRLMCT